ncbi:hypothetical protein EI427_16010 [Flammeovirga pectinis]|uniref:Porin n=1 Tax=Flammeovirga pectinis TaxID=2494373 RepID=A0A3Q9FSJ1_9BACT|nr:hypothetical protein [Flammeovirga pectinis]AZQ63674.1 hypothetical protein EI427_16010 [Flammeovirga pectinis]
MNNLYKFTGVIALLLTMFAGNASAQSTLFNRDLQYFRYNDQRGLNVFETTKSDTVGFDGVKVRVGGDFALQMQGLQHSNTMGNLQDIHTNVNLPTANLRIDAQLADGVRVNLLTYLSSRHHNDTWVMGGYLQVDNLNFLNLNSQLADDIMDIVTIKVGQMEVNYGDQHFRRTDNAYTMGNAFIGNTIMDAFATEMAMEMYAQKNGFIGMFGLSNGALNQGVTHTGNWSVYGKLGYDKQLNDDLRVRLTGSYYHNSNLDNSNLYAGDRAGSRFYNVMVPTGDDFRSGRANPNFTNNIDAVMLNSFVKFRGLEFFGTYENSQGLSKGEVSADPNMSNRTWEQLAGELVYRFGHQEQFNVGARYNTAWGTNAAEAGAFEDGTAWSVGQQDVRQNRYELSAGWFMTKNVSLKGSYIKQTYEDYDNYLGTGSTNANFAGGQFDGFMLEAAISF